MDNTRRHIRPFQDADEPAVAEVWHRAGLAAYPYLPTWQAFPLEHARQVFHEIIRPHLFVSIRINSMQKVGVHTILS